DAEKFASLNHAVTALPSPPDFNLSTPFSSPPAPGTTLLSPVGSRREKAKEEKERKMAEKEKEKADKQKKKEEQRKQDADIRAAVEASKQISKTEEMRRAILESLSKENTPQNGTALGG